MFGIEEKSPLGPIVDPKPGPTLDIDVAAPEIEVTKSSPVKDSITARRKNRIRSVSYTHLTLPTTKNV